MLVTHAASKKFIQLRRKSSQSGLMMPDKELEAAALHSMVLAESSTIKRSAGGYVHVPPLSLNAGHLSENNNNFRHRYSQQNLDISVASQIMPKIKKIKKKKAGGPA